ncbi:hypothetical protein K8Z29_22110, partial [Bacillus thuringiensis]|uniref:hypothetical protein n=1 Tax=Bacillus thuringiensis TaxID=1428 RepID=UPI001D189E6B
LFTLFFQYRYLVDKEKKRSIPVRLIRSERSLIIVLFFRGDGQKHPSWLDANLSNKKKRLLLSRFFPGV